MRNWKIRLNTCNYIIELFFFCSHKINRTIFLKLLNDSNFLYRIPKWILQNHQFPRTKNSSNWLLVLFFLLISLGVLFIIRLGQIFWVNCSSCCEESKKYGNVKWKLRRKVFSVLYEVFSTLVYIIIFFWFALPWPTMWCNNYDKKKVRKS